MTLTVGGGEEAIWLLWCTWSYQLLCRLLQQSLVRRAQQTWVFRQTPADSTSIFLDLANWHPLSNCCKKCVQYCKCDGFKEIRLWDRRATWQGLTPPRTLWQLGWDPQINKMDGYFWHTCVLCFIILQDFKVFESVSVAWVENLGMSSVLRPPEGDSCGCKKTRSRRRRFWL